MKRVLSFLLSLIIIISSLFVTGIAASAESYSGICGDDLTWSFDPATGALYITGTGAMYDYSWESIVGTEDNMTSAPWKIYLHDITALTIDEGVTGIGRYAFYNCSSLTEISLPDSLTRIGYEAFALTGYFNDNGNWSDEILYIGKHLIRGRYALPNDYTVKAGTLTIADSAFWSMVNLKSIVIPDSVVAIGSKAFSSCDGLAGVSIGKGVTVISDYAFEECRLLKSVTIPATVESIGNSAFMGCGSLTAIALPDSVKYIGNNVFASCSNLKDVYLGNALESIGSSAFEYCNSLTEMTIPDSVKSVGSRAFYNCDALTTVVFGNSVESIAASVCEDCNALTSVTIPASVTSIGSYAFHYYFYPEESYYRLSKVTVKCYENSYAHTYAVNEGFKYTFLEVEPYSGKCGDSLTWTLDIITGDLSITGTGDMYDYTSNTKAPWNAYSSYVKSVIIGDGITSIGDYAFCEIGTLERVDFSDTVTDIGDMAFFNTSLTTVALGDGVEEIGDSAFSYCKNLINALIPDSVITLGSNAFSLCPNLTNVYFGNSVKTIGDCAFIDCNALNNVTIPNSVETIGMSAFEGCSTFTEIIIPDSVTSMGNCAFMGCKGATKLKIGSSVKTINNYTFDCCLSFTSVEIPDTVEIIGAFAFEDCTALTSVTIPESVKSIGENAFHDRTGTSLNMTIQCYKDSYAHTYAVDNGFKYELLSTDEYSGKCGDSLYWSFDAESGLLEISGTGDMYDYEWSTSPWYGYIDSITSLNIGEGVTSIGENAFYECYLLTGELVIPDSVVTIAKNAFYCTSLESVVTGASLISIGENAFRDCFKLANVTLSDSVAEIGDMAFYDCNSLKTITLPETVTSIGESAFAYRTTKIMCYMYSYAYQYALNNDSTYYYGIIPRQTETGPCGANLTWTLYTDTGVLEINGTGNMNNYIEYDWMVLQYYTNNPLEPLVKYIKSVVIAEGVTSIGSYAFYNFGIIESVTIPRSVTSIAYEAFWSCSAPIYCYEDSYAHTFAVNNGLKYELIGCKHVFTNYISDDNYTCTEDGTKTAYCDKGCGETDTVIDEGSAAHRYTNEEILREPTCQRNGYKMLICNCGARVNETIPAVDHSYSEYIYNDDATCTVDGTMTAECNYACGSTDTVRADGTMLAHSFTAYIYNNDATCVAEGSETAYCDYGCGTFDTRTAEGTMGDHEYTEEIVEESTCTTKGLALYVCECGDFYTLDLPLKDHPWSDWTEVKAPTDSEVGEERRSCNVCGTAETREIAMLPKPEITVDNYIVRITNAGHIKDMRYALGEYTTTTEIRNAEGNVALSNELVMKNIVDGSFVYEMPKGGVYSIWIRMQDGRNYILPLDVTKFTSFVTTNGVTVTLHDLYNVKDFYIAKGEFNTYREIKDNGYIFSATAAKIGAKHDYTCMVKEPGLHTVLIRYNDGTQSLFHETLTVDEPVFTTNGLQVTVSNIPDVKVIRTAYGEYNTPGDTKRAAGARNFSNAAVIKNAESYKLQYREEGRITIVVEYNHGYVKVFHYDVVKKAPTVTEDNGIVTFGNLDGLVMIRYAIGEYSTSAEIKRAPGSKVIKPDAIVDAQITVSDLVVGETYTFSVQYDDESYAYTVFTVCQHDWGEWYTDNETGFKQRNCSICETVEIKCVEMPDLYGLHLDEAKLILAECNLELGNITYESTPVSPGYILEQSHKANEKVPERTRIDLLVSEGC